MCYPHVIDITQTQLNPLTIYLLGSLVCDRMCHGE